MMSISGRLKKAAAEVLADDMAAKEAAKEAGI
jgi:hypothetical protein